MLKVSGVSKTFGGLKAVQDVSLELRPNEVFGLIGPNGAGKTTLFNLVSGYHRCDTGTIHFDGRRIDQLPPHERAALGIARTFQHVQLLPEVTVLENVMTGAHLLGRQNFLGAVLRSRAQRQEEAAIEARARDALRRVGIAHLVDEYPVNLAYGLQRRVEVARAIVGIPKLLLLDEPAAGLNDAETEELGELIRSVAADGVTVLLVEHAMPLVMSVCDRILVLDFGQPIAQGTPAEIQTNQRVIEAYLGEADEEPQHA